MPKIVSHRAFAARARGDESSDRPGRVKRCLRDFSGFCDLRRGPATPAGPLDRPGTARWRSPSQETRLRRTTYAGGVRVRAQRPGSWDLAAARRREERGTWLRARRSPAPAPSPQRRRARSPSWRDGPASVGRPGGYRPSWSGRRPSCPEAPPELASPGPLRTERGAGAHRAQRESRTTTFAPRGRSRNSSAMSSSYIRMQPIDDSVPIVSGIGVPCAPNPV